MLGSGVSSVAAEEEEAGEALYSSGVLGIRDCSADAVNGGEARGGGVR